MLKDMMSRLLKHWRREILRFVAVMASEELELLLLSKLKEACDRFGDDLDH